MTNPVPDNETARDELLQRVELMETMIAEGRKSTARFGWIFVMWGLIYFAAMGWVVFLPFKEWAWPVSVTVGILVGVIRFRRMRAMGIIGNDRGRSVGVVWQAMCVAIILYVIAAGASGHGNQPAYYAAVFFFVGLAHGTSAGILRWGVQGLVAFIWWGCGIALFFFTDAERGPFHLPGGCVLRHDPVRPVRDDAGAAEGGGVGAGSGATSCLNSRNSIRWFTES